MKHLRENLPVQLGIVYDQNLLTDLFTVLLKDSVRACHLTVDRCHHRIFVVLCAVHQLVRHLHCIFNLVFFRKHSADAHGQLQP